MAMHTCVRFCTNEKVIILFLTQGDTISGDSRHVTGFPLSEIGLGCKNDEHTLASPNTKDIPRLAMEKTATVTMKIPLSDEPPVPILVVSESYVYEAKFLAFADVAIPLYMINDTDTLAGYQHHFRIPQLDFTLATLRNRLPIDRSQLFDNYFTLSQIRSSVRTMLAVKDDKKHRTVSFYVDQCFVNAALQYFTHELGPKPSTTITMNESNRNARKCVGTAYEKFIVSESLFEISSTEIPAFLMKMIGEHGCWAPHGTIGKTPTNVLQGGGALFNRISVLSSMGKLSFTGLGLCTLSVDVESQRMQQHPLNKNILNPNDAPVMPLDDDAKVSMQVSYLPNSASISVPLYLVYGNQLLKRRNVVREAYTLTKKQQLDLYQAGVDVEDENDPPNEQLQVAKRPRTSKLATVPVEYGVYECVHFPFTELRLSGEQVSGSSIATMYSSLQHFEDGHVSPLPRPLRKLIYHFTNTQEPPTKHTPLRWIEGLLTQQNWSDQVSFMQMTASYLKAYKTDFKKHGLDMYVQLWNYYQLSAYPEEQTLEGLANALLRKMCSLYSDWEYVFMDLQLSVK